MVMKMVMMMMGQMMLLPRTIYMGHAGHMGGGRKCPDLHHRPKAAVGQHNGDDDDNIDDMFLTNS